MMHFETMTVSSKKWAVMLIYEGRGLSGEYNPIKDDTGVQDNPVLKMVISKKENRAWVIKHQTDTYLFATDDVKLLDKAIKLVLSVLDAYKPDEMERFFYQSLGYIHLRGKTPSLKIEFEKEGCDKK